MAALFGIILIALGISTIFNIPIFSWIFGALLIYWGLSLLTSTHWHRSIKRQVYERGKTFEQKTEINLSNNFGEQTVDVADLVEGSGVYAIRSSTSFGTTTIKLDPSIKTRVIGSANFGTATLPNGSVSFGKLAYKNYFGHETPQVTIKAHVSFGTLIVLD